VSVDASCSGRRASCAAVLTTNSRIVAEWSRSLPEVGGYVLAAEIGAIALAAELIAEHAKSAPVIVEIDNPMALRVLLEGLKLPQNHRIPTVLRKRAADLLHSGRVTVRMLPRNSSPGLRRADRVARKRLWRR